MKKSHFFGEKNENQDESPLFPGKSRISYFPAGATTNPEVSNLLPKKLCVLYYLL
jgi:hypothetical protein